MLHHRDTSTHASPRGSLGLFGQPLKHTAGVVRIRDVIRKGSGFRLKQCVFTSFYDVVRRRRLLVAPLMEEVRADSVFSDSSNRTPASQPCGTWGVGMNRKLYCPVDKRSSLVKARAGRIEKSFTLTRAPTKPHTAVLRVQVQANYLKLHIRLTRNG